jgi:OOP family OmpA-OmpF porin
MPLTCRAGVVALATCLLSPVSVQALGLEFVAPAVATVVQSQPLSSYALPIGPWRDGVVPTRLVEGARTDAAWRVDAAGLTTLQLLAPLRDQLVAAGYSIIWECETLACGGFDFRFAIDVLDEPDMHVDLGDFRFLAAERDGSGGPEAVSILVSRSSGAGFVQMVSMGAALDAVSSGLATQDKPDATPPAPPPPPADFAAALETGGSVPLDDLIFESGSAALGKGDFDSLDALAAYLAANPGRTVALVGHTDASGALAGNVALSTARAASVRDRLIKEYGVMAQQVMAEGVGYLAPRATNLTPEGRAKNRRVEVMITSTQ